MLQDLAIPKHSSLSVDNGSWRRLGKGGCSDENNKQYSWYYSKVGNFKSAKTECMLHINCLGIMWGKWDRKGLILVDAAGVDEKYSGSKQLDHVDKGKGPIVALGLWHPDSTCYTYNRTGIDTV